MKLTPLDIHHKEFGRALRGYNEAEVDEFLDQVADELERLFKENITLSERLEALEQKLREYQDMERTLHNTLLSAQRSADELLRKAEQEAEVVLKDAEVKAKEVIHSALTEKQRATTELARIKQAEEEFRGAFKRLLEDHLKRLAPVPMPEDVTLMVAQAGEETIAEAEVFAWEPAPTAEPVVFEEPVFVAEAEEPSSAVTEPAEEPSVAVSVPAEEPLTAASAKTPAEEGSVSSLHLGEVGETPLPPDAFVEFNVAEFGYGEREDDVDIEEID